MEYTFSPALADELPAVFALIKDRIAWMDEVGLHQWNVLDYWGVFPESYYTAAVREGRLFVVHDASGAGAGAGVLSFRDPFWHGDASPALYLHNFVTARHAKGAGDAFLAGCERFALAHNKPLFRLDCAADNTVLNDYYAARGFAAAGTVEDGPYKGILREKRL